MKSYFMLEKLHSNLFVSVRLETERAGYCYI